MPSRLRGRAATSQAPTRESVTPRMPLWMLLHQSPRLQPAATRMQAALAATTDSVSLRADVATFCSWHGDLRRTGETPVPRLQGIPHTGGHGRPQMVEPSDEGKDMTTTTPNLARLRRLPLDGGAMAALAAAALAFNLGGALHPNDGGQGGKVDQLHDMLLHGTWYASHLSLLASFSLFTVAFPWLQRRRVLAPGTRRTVRVIAVVSAVTTVAMVPHLLAPLGADSLANGQLNALSSFMTIDETLADAPWALGVATLALVAGVGGDLGNRVTAVAGVVGGVSFAAAAVTIPFTDALDGLFAVGGMGITLWGLGVVAASAWRWRTGPLTQG